MPETPTTAPHIQGNTSPVPWHEAKALRTLRKPSAQRESSSFVRLQAQISPASLRFFPTVEGDCSRSYEATPQPVPSSIGSDPLLDGYLFVVDTTSHARAGHSPGLDLSSSSQIGSQRPVVPRVQLSTQVKVLPFIGPPQKRVKDFSPALANPN